MSIRIRNNKYVVDYYPSGRKGPRKRLTLPKGTTEEQAADIHNGLVKKKKNTASLFSRSVIKYLAPKYLDYVKMHQQERTYDDKVDCFNNHLLPFFRSYSIPEINNALISLYQKKRVAEFAAMKDEDKKKHGIKDGHRSINKELAYFGGLLKWARKQLRVRPEDPIEREDLPYNRPTPMIWTKDELNSFIDAAEPEYKVIFLALFRLCQRITATVRLEWDRLDLQKEPEKSSVIFLGKGNKENRLPLLKDIHKELWILKKERDATPVELRSRWVFPSPVNRDKPINDVGKAIARAKEKTKIEKRLHPHLIRHSAATHMVEDGVDIRVIQTILGHSQITTTEWYTHIALELKRAAMEKTAGQ